MATQRRRSYVYMLRDPDLEKTQGRVASIFYVGKGTGLRAEEHVRAAQASLQAALADNPADDQKRALNKKLARIERILAGQKQVLIDVLVDEQAFGLPSTTAFDVEAALIAVLDMTELGNKIRGHKVRLLPESVFDKAGSAMPTPMPPDTAIITVPVKGAWGGQDYAGTLISADEATVWNNARQLWTPLSAERQRQIKELAGTDKPAVLVALAPNPKTSNRNLVLGVYELAAAKITRRLKGGYTNRQGNWVPKYRGYEFLRVEEADETDSTRKLRKMLLWNILCDQKRVPLVRAEGFRYEGTLKN